MCKYTAAEMGKSGLIRHQAKNRTNGCHGWSVFFRDMWLKIMTVL